MIRSGNCAPRGAAAILPRGWLESIAWVVVAVSAGFCEEIVFRGYLQGQFRVWTGNASVAIVLQGALFGIAHGEQGLASIAGVTLYGLAFGMLAHWRRSLVPGIACHIWTDTASGLFAALAVWAQCRSACSAHVINAIGST